MAYIGKKPTDVPLSSADLAADVIDGTKIADDAIDSEHYTDGSIDNAHIADDAIDSEHYAAGSIDEAHIAADAVNFATHLKAGTDGELITWDASGDPAAVAVGTATHLLTSNGAGAAPTFQAAPSGGKLLQVVSTTKTDASSATVTSYTDIAGMSVAITPAATSSKILVTVWIQASSANTSTGAYYKLLRGTTAINIGDADGSRERVFGNMFPSNSDNGASFTGTSFLDSPSSTSEETYKVQWAAGPSNQANHINQPRATVDSNRYVRMTSGIMVQEIGA